MNAAVILAGGTGSRLSSFVPKQYLRVGGSMVVTRTLRVFLDLTEIDTVRIVADTTWRQAILAELSKRDIPKLSGFSEPGSTRQLSIWNALRDLRTLLCAEDIVILHDAVRPLVKKGIILDCLDACRNHDGAMPVLPMKDTVYLSTNGKTVSSLLDRNTVYAGQAPEAYRFGKYLSANEALLPEQILHVNGSTEAAILSGIEVALLPGDESNFKITTQSDLAMLQRILEEEHS